MKRLWLNLLGRSRGLHFLIPPCDVGPIVILYLIQVSVQVYGTVFNYRGVVLGYDFSQFP